MFSKLLVVMAVSAVAVNAQTVPGVSDCASQCIIGAATQNGCTSFTDVACVCGNAQFQADAGTCLTTFCTAADVAAGQAARTSVCANAVTTITPTNTATGVNTITVTSGAAASANGTSSSTATSVTGTALSSGSTPSASTPSASTPSASTPRASSSTGTATTGTGTTATGATAAASDSATPSSAANSLVSNSGVVAFLAMIAGFLAL